MNQNKKRFFAAMLVVCLLCSVLPSFSRADESKDTDVYWEKLTNAVGSGITPDGQQTEPDSTDTQEETYKPDEAVRVSIELTQPSVMKSGYSTRGLGNNKKALSYSDKLKGAQKKLAQQISEDVLGGETLSVEWNLTIVANVISAVVPYGKIDQIAALSGVQDVYVEPCFDVPETTAGDDLSTAEGTSLQMTGTDLAWAAGYTGAGSRIAIIDTGLNSLHDSFNNGAWEYSLAQNAAAVGMSTQAYKDSLNLLDAQEVAAVLPRLNAKAKLSTLTAAKLAISGKLPFAFNYVDRNLNTGHTTDTQGVHGSHVSGIAAANRYIASGSGYVDAASTVYAVGEAPDAQVLIMKVFGAKGGAFTSDYMAAIEDAILLNCDAVNLSLQSAKSGTSGTGYASFEAIMDALMQSDTVATISAGNTSSWSNYTTNGKNYIGSTNMDTVASPGSLTGAFTCASVQTDTTISAAYLGVGTAQIAYYEKVYNQTSISTLDTQQSGSLLDYIVLTGTGAESEYTGKDVTGKVVVVNRGGTAYAAKLATAQSHGAAALVIANNVSSAFTIDLSTATATIPCVGISKLDKTKLLAQSAYQTNKTYTGKMEIHSTAKLTDTGSAGYEMSAFSSWGVPDDLSLKPEITAPGGAVYSVNGAAGSESQYKQMSGTSMAAPAVAGSVAVVGQYIRDNNLTSKTGLTQRTLAQSLLMGTAEPIMNEQSGTLYSMLQQGAGLVNIGNAVNADAYLLVDGQADGKVKAELGDDPEHTGEYTVKFTVNNLTDADVTYLMNGTVLTQDYYRDYANDDARNDHDESRMCYFMDNATAEMDADIFFTAEGTATQLDTAIAQCDFDNDADVDEADAQALLDRAMGLRGELHNEQLADFDGSGSLDTYDAQLFASKLRSRAITVPAGGSVAVTAKIVLSDTQKALLDEIYVGGAYVEAYLRLHAVGDGEGNCGSDLGIPVLAYYGSWTDSEMFSTYSWEKYNSDSAERLEQPYIKEDSNYFRLYSKKYGYIKVGGNPYLQDSEFLADRLAFNSSATSDTWLSDFCVTPIRNAATSRFVLTDAQSGEIYYSEKIGMLSAAYSTKTLNSWSVSPVRRYFNWVGTGKDGVTPLAEGTVVNATVQAAPQYNVSESGVVDWDALGEGSKYSLQLAIDNTAPEVTSLVRNANNSKTLTVSVEDNRYVAAVMLLDSTGQQTLQSVNPNQTQIGAVTELTLDISSYRGTKFVLVVCDYAMNETYYKVDLEGRVQTGVTNALRGLSAANNYWMAFDATVEANEYLLSRQTQGFILACYADGMVFAATNGSLYAFPETDNYENAVYVGSADYSTLRGLTFDRDTKMLYSSSVSGVKGLVQIDPFTGTTTSFGNFTYNSTSVTVNAIAYSQGGLYYALSDAMVLYSFTVGTSGLSNLTQIGSLGQSVQAGAVQFGLTWDNREQVLYCTNGTMLNRLNTQTGVATQVGTLSAPLQSLFAADADESTTHWYDPVQNVESVSFADSAVSLYCGEQTTLQLYYTPWNLSDTEIIWSSADTAIATVENGTVTGVSSGQTELYAHLALDSAKIATCTVTVSSPKVSFAAIAANENGSSQLLQWNGGNEKRSSTAQTVQEDFLSAVLTENGSYWAQTTDGRILRLDKSTGASLQSIAANSDSRLATDMTVSREYGGVYSINGAKIFSPWDISENNPGSKPIFDMLSTLTYGGATRFLSIASAGYFAFSWEGDEEQYDTERLFLLDNAGNLWAAYIMFFDGEYSCVMETYYTVTGLENYVIHAKDGQLRNSLIYDEQTGDLVLAGYTGSDAQYYLLHAQEEEWTATPIGSTDNASVALFESTTPAVRKAVAVQSPARGVNAGTVDTVYEQDIGPEPDAEDTPIETQALTEVTASAETQAPIEETATVETQATVEETAPTATQEEAEKTASEKRAAVKTATKNTVSIPIRATKYTTNQRIHVEYDPSALTLVGIRSAMELTAYSQADGSIDFGCASALASYAGQTVATLLFTYDGAYADGSVKITETEHNASETSTSTVYDYNDEASGHSYRLTAAQAATCTEDGSQTYTCVGCGDSYVTVLPATGHSFASAEETLAPTCTEQGLVVCTCTVCGFPKTTTIETLGHNYVPSTGKGRTVYTCTRCGDSYGATDTTKPRVSAP